MEYIQGQAGFHFDPRVVDLFSSYANETDQSYRLSRH